MAGWPGHFAGCLHHVPTSAEKPGPLTSGGVKKCRLSSQDSMEGNGVFWWVGGSLNLTHLERPSKTTKL